MAVKCIAIGNRIMGDDSIGIKIAEKLRFLLKAEDIEIIIGETDSDFIFEKIEEEDFLFLIDATYFGLNPGTVSFIDLNKVIENQSGNNNQHQNSLLNLLNIYNKKIKGFIIGIEVEYIELGMELSSTLKSLFPELCMIIYKFIICKVRGPL